jgi:hypothetical protein
MAEQGTVAESGNSVCHHCRRPFDADGTRISADVLLPDGARERIFIHEGCIPEDRYLAYFWENLTIDRMRA